MQEKPAVCDSGSDSYSMENWPSFLKSTDISEDFLQNCTGIESVLSHPVGPVGIGTDGYNFAAQLLESAEIIRRG